MKNSTKKKSGQRTPKQAKPPTRARVTAGANRLTQELAMRLLDAAEACQQLDVIKALLLTQMATSASRASSFGKQLAAFEKSLANQQDLQATDVYRAELMRMEQVTLVNMKLLDQHVRDPVMEFRAGCYRRLRHRSSQPRRLMLLNVRMSQMQTRCVLVRARSSRDGGNCLASHEATLHDVSCF